MDVPAKYFSPDENKRFWNAAVALPIEEFGFSIPYATKATLPPTLKKPILLFDESIAINPMPILQPPNLHTLIVESRNFWRNEDTLNPVDIDDWEISKPIPYERVACHQL
jgi:hypothetical protein